MKKLILHVGTHKTATSSIQATLAKNSEALLKQGFYYPIFLRNEKKILNHSIPFYSVFTEQPENYHINITNGDAKNIEKVNENYFNQIKEALNSDKNVIISGEDISILSIDALTKLKQLIINAGFTLEVYCAVREPFSFTCSELQERIKNGVATMSEIKVPKSSKIIEKLKIVFQNEINFFLFEKDCNRYGPVFNFLKRIGVKSNDINIINANEGMGNITIRLFEYLNRFNPVIKNKELNAGKRKVFFTSIDTNKFLLTKEEYKSIEHEIIEERKNLSKVLGYSIPSGKKSFARDFSLDITTAKKIIDNYFEVHTCRRIVEFINNHSKFHLIDLCEYYKDNADVLRDIGLVLEKTDLNSAYKAMSLAHKARPNGPLIKKKLEEYKKELSEKALLVI